jgi:hypothetical protein
MSPFWCVTRGAGASSIRVSCSCLKPLMKPSFAICNLYVAQRTIWRHADISTPAIVSAEVSGASIPHDLDGIRLLLSGSLYLEQGVG